MCMGRTHVLIGTVLALGAAQPIAESTVHQHLDFKTYCAVGITVAGYSVLPDLDHPRATLARVLGPATKAVATAVAQLSGGHRKGTHTVWFAGLVTLLVSLLAAKMNPSTFTAPEWMGSFKYSGHFWLTPVFFIGAFLFLMILRIAPRSKKGDAVYAVEAVALTAAAYHYVTDWWWLPYSVGFGVIAHIVGDMMTAGLVPVFYPISKRKFGVPVLGKTDSFREHTLALALIPLAVWMLYTAYENRNWYDTAWLHSAGIAVLLVPLAVVGTYAAYRMLGGGKPRPHSHAGR